MFKTESNNSAHGLQAERSIHCRISTLTALGRSDDGTPKKRKGGESGRGGGAEERRERTAAFPDAVSMSSHCYWSLGPGIQTTRIAGREGKRMR